MASTAHTNNNLVKDSNYQARLAHVALAAQVREQGTDCARALYEATQTFNAELFAGALLPLFVELTPPGSLRALADYRPRSQEGVDSHIRIGAKVVEKGARYALDVLLHEMMHAYCFEILGVEKDKTEKTYGWHGPKWAAQCNRVGRMLGLAEVFVKGRGGPNAAQWPMCVRPAGYYGGEEKTTGEPTGEPREPSSPEDEQAKIAKAIARLLAKADQGTLEAVWIAVGSKLGALS